MIPGGPAAAPDGSGLPLGARFFGGPSPFPAGWLRGDAPADADLSQCVACGLCLPHCPTYRETGLEVASPRGRIAAMRQVAQGEGVVDEAFRGAMDLCLGCRACETACPSHVPFGRLLEGARAQAEPGRRATVRLLRRVGFDLILSHPPLVTAAATAASAVRPLLPPRLRGLVPPGQLRRRPLARVTEPLGPIRGTLALLRGCIQDRWYREVNRATVVVLARAGWRVVVAPGQACCGALHAHYGHLDAARRLARRNAEAFAGFDHLVVNAAGCGAHLKTLGELVGAHDLAERVQDLSEFLDRTGAPPVHRRIDRRVAVHDACHLLHAQGIQAAPRRLLGAIPGVELVPIAAADRCCGAAGLYNLLQPAMSDELAGQKAAAIAASGAAIVAVANPGCAMQIASALVRRGSPVRVAHPAQLLAAASRPRRGREAAPPVGTGGHPRLGEAGGEKCASASRARPNSGPSPHQR